MPSSNPAFNRGFANAGNGSQYPGWGAQPQQYGAPTQYGAPAQHDPYAAPSPYAPPATHYMTMDDVVTKTGVSFLVTVLTAAAVWAMPGQAAWGLALPAVLVAFVLGLVIAIIYFIEYAIYQYLVEDYAKIVLAKIVVLF